jgi:hypothetical protein
MSILLVSASRDHPEPIDKCEVCEIESAPPQPSPTAIDNPPFAPEFENVNIPDEEDKAKPYRQLLLSWNGDVTIGECEIPPIRIKNWMVLFRRGHKYTLEKRRVGFGRRLSDSFGSFRSLMFKDKNDAVFMFPDTHDLEPGRITTIPESSWKTTTRDGIPDFDVAVSKKIRLGDRDYILRRSTSVREESKLPLSVLVIEGDGLQQIVYYKWFDREISPELGDFEWFGDFDGDGRLDFIFSYFDQNGGGQSFILFASSIAKPNELVRPYAFYHTRFQGC